MTPAIGDWRARLRRELRAARRLFVLGVGNPDRADDGAGGRCVRTLGRLLEDSPLFDCQGGRSGKTKTSGAVLRCRAVHSSAGGETGPAPTDTAAPAAGMPHDARPRLDVNAPAEIGLLDGGAVPESATGPVREFAPSHVLIVDAASGGHVPGSVFFMDRKRIREDDLTTHRIPLSHLVRYLEETVGCRVILLGIEPRVLEPGGPISRPVGRAARDIAETLARLLSR